jgi:hypothetical protein
MKMKMELIRKLLIYFQDNLPENFSERSDFINISNYTKEEIIYHVALLKDKGYIDAKCFYESNLEICDVRRLTFDGNQLLGLMKDQRTWGILRTALKDTIVVLPLLAPYIAPLVPKLLGLP